MIHVGQQIKYEISLTLMLYLSYTLYRILFHFHKNDSTHVRAKVAPPRLNGIRTGVFATRSPHRPCPIGLSLVQIDKVEGNFMLFKFLQFYQMF